MIEEDGERVRISFDNTEFDGFNESASVDNNEFEFDDGFSDEFVRLTERKSADNNELAGYFGRFNENLSDNELTGDFDRLIESLSTGKGGLTGVTFRLIAFGGPVLEPLNTV